jgi:hypothetical protein
MAQDSLVINCGQSGANVIDEINKALKTISTHQSGTSTPTTPNEDGELFYNTSEKALYFFHNSQYRKIAEFDGNELRFLAVVDNSISLDKMAKGTPNKIIGFNAQGNPEEITVSNSIANNSIGLDKLAHGTPNKFIRFNNAGVPAEITIIDMLHFHNRKTLTASGTWTVPPETFEIFIAMTGGGGGGGGGAGYYRGGHGNSGGTSVFQNFNATGGGRGRGGHGYYIGGINNGPTPTSIDHTDARLLLSNGVGGSGGSGGDYGGRGGGGQSLFTYLSVQPAQQLTFTSGSGGGGGAGSAGGGSVGNSGEDGGLVIAY